MNKGLEIYFFLITVPRKNKKNLSQYLKNTINRDDFVTLNQLI